MQVDLNGTAWAQAFTNPYTAADPNTAYTVGMWVKAPLGYHYSFGAVALDASNAYISTFIGQADNRHRHLAARHRKRDNSPWHGIDCGLYR